MQRFLLVRSGENLTAASGQIRTPSDSRPNYARRALAPRQDATGWDLCLRRPHAQRVASADMRQEPAQSAGCAHSKDSGVLLARKKPMSRTSSATLADRKSVAEFVIIDIDSDLVDAISPRSRRGTVTRPRSAPACTAWGRYAKPELRSPPMGSTVGHVTKRTDRCNRRAADITVGITWVDAVLYFGKRRNRGIHYPPILRTVIEHQPYMTQDDENRGVRNVRQGACPRSLP